MWEGLDGHVEAPHPLKNFLGWHEDAATQVLHELVGAVEPAHFPVPSWLKMSQNHPFRACFTRADAIDWVQRGIFLPRL